MLEAFGRFDLPVSVDLDQISIIWLIIWKRHWRNVVQTDLCA